MTPSPDNPRQPTPPQTVDLPSGAPAAGPAGAAPAVSRAFGDYELLGEVERGGMGIVYQARERTSGRLVALKMMLDQSASSQADLSRFVLEAQAAGELHHPGVVAIHAWGIHEGHPFYTMDFVPGRPLHKVLADGPLPFDQAVRYLVGVARALAAAHALNIVHRDLKPSNVMIDSADQPRVLDFGLAKRQGTAEPVAAEDEVLDVLPVDEPLPQSRATPRVSAPVTEKGAILGTPSYMAPEQVRAEHQRVGPPADVHALGAIFYEMMTGKPPFVGDSTYATLMEVLNKEPAPMGSLRPHVPATLEAFCGRCLAKDARDRYPEAGALADDLERRWKQATHGARFARLALLAAAALVVLQAVQPLIVGHPSSDPGTLEGVVRALIPRSGALHDAAGVLDRLLHGLIVVGGPLVAGLGLFVWAGAWAWHAERRALGLALSAVAAVVVTVVWLAAWGIPEPTTGFLPWVLVANTISLVAVTLYRHASAPEPEEAPAAEGESYLRKLFAVRGNARPRKATVAGSAAAEMADFDLGKRLHVWEGGAVHWARQKSIDRAVLVWRDTRPSPDGSTPGVIVRHPAVLGLHAVGAVPDARLLVTEYVAASPLAEVLSQRPLTSREAIALTAKLAEAVQAFHDQGACHGRLGPDWILVNGDLEPALCPCGVPIRSPDDRAADLQALVGLLTGWLPRRPWAWRYEALAAVYRVCDAARDGAYERPADFAADLGRADRAGRVRWRERWAGALILVLLLFPWIFLVGRRLVGHEPGAATDLPPPLPLTLVFLCPAGVLAGYAQVRSLIQYLRLRRRGSDRILPGGMTAWLALGAVFLALTLAAGCTAVIDEGQSLRATLPSLVLVLSGFWVVGAGLAALVTFGELLAGSLRREPAPAGDAAA